MNNEYDIVKDLRSQAKSHPLDVNLDILDEAADEIVLLRQQLAQKPSVDVLDAKRYRCLMNMATRDYEASAQYQFVGRLNEFVDAMQPSVDEAMNEAKHEND